MSDPTAEDPATRLARARGLLARGSAGARPGAGGVGAATEAIALLEPVVEAAFKAKDRRLQAEGLVLLSRALEVKGELDTALLCAERAAGAARTAGHPDVVADACERQAAVLAAQGQKGQARSRLAEASAALDEALATARGANQVDLLLRAVAVRDGLLALGPGEASTLRVLQLEAAERSDERDRRRDELLRTLFGLSRRLVEERDPERVVVTILEAAVEATGAERGFLLLAPEPRPEPEAAPTPGRLPGGLEIAAARNADRAAVRQADHKVSRAVLDEALRRQAPVVVHDAGGDAALAEQSSVHAQGLRSIVCVPFASARGVRGALYLDNRFGPGAFAADQLEALDAFAAHAAVALESARLHARGAREREALDAARARAEELARRLEVEMARQGEELGVTRERLSRAQEGQRAGLGDLVGRSHLMQAVYAFVPKVARTEHPVLVRGESGTGKELVARAIHSHGPRFDGPFISENCGAIPETLLESVLFGHEVGAFTGATERRRGLFELAGEGTLFLDEVGELPLAHQAALLRVLEEKKVRRVGGSDAIPVRARLVCATHRDLEAMVRAGTFREDLYYRLNVLSVRLPALRERRDDIPQLVDHLLARAAARAGRPAPTLPVEVRRALVRHEWPGNVRELENELQRLLTLAGETIGLEDLSPALRAERPAGAPAASPDAIPTLEAGERRFIQQALEATGNNKIRAAALLGIPRGTLWHKMKQHGLG